MAGLVAPLPATPHRSTRMLAWSIGFGVTLVAVCLVLLGYAGDYAARYATVCCIGAGVGTGELVSRYRDRPELALASPPAIGYILLNGAASATALGVILTFGWTFGLSKDDAAAVTATQILIAGFGSMALFRTSLFTVRVGDQDVGIGPSSLLSIVLAACDRGVDRTRAEDRAAEVGRIMSDVAFVPASTSLPAVAIALMQNLETPDQAALGMVVTRLQSSTELTDPAKSLLLGLAISNLVGPLVLERAKDAIGPEILRTSVSEVQVDDQLVDAMKRLSGQAAPAEPGRPALAVVDTLADAGRHPDAS
ncbi:hypothetical protein [Solirubrobacter soli]|uniref:hypothetical protein n=1 Tax=Solirubrobacter soli TaxID=363832 RepID=UPI00041FC17E|nr:hypothetical protein [Solirubrobacter soli]